MPSNLYLEVSVHGKVFKVNLDSESAVVSSTVGVVEPGHSGDVEVYHVLLDLLRDVVTISGAVPGHSQLRLGSLVHDDAVGVPDTTAGAQHGAVVFLVHDALAPPYLVTPGQGEHGQHHGQCGDHHRGGVHGVMILMESADISLLRLRGYCQD